MSLGSHGGWNLCHSGMSQEVAGMKRELDPRAGPNRLRPTPTLRPSRSRGQHGRTRPTPKVEYKRLTLKAEADSEGRGRHGRPSPKQAMGTELSSWSRNRPDNGVSSREPSPMTWSRDGPRAGRRGVGMTESSKESMTTGLESARTPRAWGRKHSVDSEVGSTVGEDREHGPRIAVGEAGVRSSRLCRRESVMVAGSCLCLRMWSRHRESEPVGMWHRQPGLASATDSSIGQELRED